MREASNSDNDEEEDKINGDDFVVVDSKEKVSRSGSRLSGILGGFSMKKKEEGKEPQD